MMKKRVLFIDEVHPILAEGLRAAGFDCHLKYDITREEVRSIIAQYNGVVIRSKFKLDKTVLEAASNLEFIARSGSGMENIDVQAAAQLGVSCFNSPEGNRDAVAEHALGMLLCLFNNLRKADLEVRQGIWLREQNRGLELKGKTVGIIGVGYMGSAFAQRLAGFECKVIGFDKYKSGYQNEFIQEATLETLYEHCDILSIHLPLSSETTNYVNRDFIGRFKKPFYLINTSRGKQVVTAHLVEALNNGKVLGACLDVLEYESVSFGQLQTDVHFENLIKLSNVIFSPHVAGWTLESYEKLSSYLLQKILNHYGIKLN